MTVDTAQNVTTLVRIHTGAQVALPVRPGDSISATLCLQTNSAGTAFYGLVNETTAQTVTDGTPTTMVDSNGSTLAIPQRLNDTAFKVIYRGP